MQWAERVRAYVRMHGAGYTLHRAGEMLAARVLLRDEWRFRREKASKRELAVQRAQPFPDVRISVVVPVFNTRPKFLRALADSLLHQSCGAWEACFYDGASTRADTRELLQALTQEDNRFRVTFGAENRGIAGNTNAALTMATGEFVALCDHDDLLAPDAVRCILEAAQDGADFVYTDEDKVSADGTHFFEPHLKPDFAPDSLRSGNYICHITAASRALMNAVGGLRPGFDGSQDHDLALRLSENATKITHIPRILYHWRMLDTSFSHQKAQTCADAAARAVADQLRRLHMDADVTVEELRVRIRWKTRQMRIVCILWGEGDAPKLPMPCIRVRDLSAVNDLVRRMDCDAVLFLRAGLRPLDTDWVSELMQYAQRADVGCVGSALLDDRDCFRHAGYAVGVPGGAISHQAGQWRYGRPYMLTDRIVRNVTGVSSALLMIRRDVFLSVGGFSPYQSDLRGADLGLKCQQIGLLNVYTPYARMAMDMRLSLLPPCLTQGAPKGDLRRFRQTWGAHPPERYYSPLFRPDGSMFIDLDRQEGTP